MLEKQEIMNAVKEIETTSYKREDVFVCLARWAEAKGKADGTILSAKGAADAYAKGQIEGMRIGTEQTLKNMKDSHLFKQLVADAEAFEKWVEG